MSSPSIIVPVKTRPEKTAVGKDQSAGCPNQAVSNARAVKADAALGKSNFGKLYGRTKSLSSSGIDQPTKTLRGGHSSPDVLLTVVRDLDLGLAGHSVPPDWTPPPVPKPRRLPVPRKRLSLVSGLTLAEKTGGAEDSVASSTDQSSSDPSDVQSDGKQDRPGRFLGTYFSVEEPVSVDSDVSESEVFETSQVVDVDEDLGPSSEANAATAHPPYQAEFETLKRLSEASINALKGKSPSIPLNQESSVPEF